jgi:hypothetical protein
MTPECHRLAERLERARLLRRWSEVLAVAQQLNGLGNDRAVAEGKQNGTGPNSPKRSDVPTGSVGTRRVDKDFDVVDSPNVLPIRPQKVTRSATWLQKWWSLAFPLGGAKKGVNVSEDRDANRFLLWVDAVGGFLVCTGDEVVIGQPVSGHEVDIPIRGDLSRRHAVIHRDREGYLIEPIREVTLNGKPVERTASLRDGDRLMLGESVAMRFRRPHPLSHSARLEPLSYHRTQPATDGVLLLADSCILGPAAANHVVCPDWPNDIVVFRQGASLGCRSPKPFKVDGAIHQGRAPLGERAQVAGEGFSFSIEPA